MAADALYGADDDKDAAARDLADRLKDEAEEAMPELEEPWSLLLSAAMSEIDWHEIAENLITEVKE